MTHDFRSTIVTGQVPFSGTTRMEVILNHAKEPPIPPHELVPDLPAALSQAILKMLAKAPEDRFQNYEELRRALDDAPLAA